MRIKLTEQLADYEGRKLLDGNNPVTFRRVFVTALNAFGENERSSPEQMAMIYALSTRLYSANEIDLSLEEAALIKDRVGKTYNPLVYGRTCDLLEGNKTKKK